MSDAVNKVTAITEASFLSLNIEMAHCGQITQL